MLNHIHVSHAPPPYLTMPFHIPTSCPTTSTCHPRSLAKTQEPQPLLQRSMKRQRPRRARKRRQSGKSSSRCVRVGFKDTARGPAMACSFVLLLHEVLVCMRYIHVCVRVCLESGSKSRGLAVPWSCSPAFAIRGADADMSVHESVVGTAHRCSCHALRTC